MVDAHPLCEICGEPMPKGEEMFKFHGFSGPCPKPPLPKQDDSADITELQHRINFLEQNETVVWEVLKIQDGSTIHDVVAAVSRLRAIEAAAREWNDARLEHRKRCTVDTHGREWYALKALESALAAQPRGEG